jgi:hypothetical protein
MGFFYDIRLPVVPTEWLPLLEEDVDPFREFRAVTLASPKTVRKAVWQLALYFKREFHYDFCQYGHEGNETDADAVAFLWTTNHPSRIDMQLAVGACCFRLRGRHDGTRVFALQWIWFHPYKRSQGLLKRAWPYFRSRFGTFVVEQPLSHAMEAFLREYDRNNEG